MADLILTCPHAQCDINQEDYDKHWCDWIAELALIELTTHLDEFGVSHEEFVGSEYRKDCDLNRIPARGTPFRKKVRKALEKGVMHVDVHSYPDIDKSDDWWQYDVVIFDHDSTEMIESMKTNLNQEGYNVKVIPSDEVNDICNEATDLGAESCLIEFNAKLQDSDRLHDACKAVAKSIHMRRNRRNARIRKPDIRTLTNHRQRKPSKIEIENSWEFYEKQGYRITNMGGNWHPSHTRETAMFAIRESGQDTLGPHNMAWTEPVEWSVSGIPGQMTLMQHFRESGLEYLWFNMTLRHGLSLEGRPYSVELFIFNDDRLGTWATFAKRGSRAGGKWERFPYEWDAGAVKEAEYTKQIFGGERNHRMRQPKRKATSWWDEFDWRFESGSHDLVAEKDGLRFQWRYALPSSSSVMAFANIERSVLPNAAKGNYYADKIAELSGGRMDWRPHSQSWHLIVGAHGPRGEIQPGWDWQMNNRAWWKVMHEIGESPDPEYYGCDEHGNTTHEYLGAGQWARPGTAQKRAHGPSFVPPWNQTNHRQRQPAIGKKLLPSQVKLREIKIIAEENGHYENIRLRNNKGVQRVFGARPEETLTMTRYRYKADHSGTPAGPIVTASRFNFPYFEIKIGFDRSVGDTWLFAVLEQRDPQGALTEASENWWQGRFDNIARELGIENWRRGAYNPSSNRQTFLFPADEEFASKEKHLVNARHRLPKMTKVDYWAPAINKQKYDSASPNDSMVFYLDEREFDGFGYEIKIEPEFAGLSSLFGGRTFGEDLFLTITRCTIEDYPSYPALEFKPHTQHNWQEMGKVTGKDWIAIRNLWASEHYQLKNDLADAMDDRLQNLDEYQNENMWRKWQEFGVKLPENSRLEREMKAYHGTRHNPYVELEKGDLVEDNFEVVDTVEELVEKVKENSEVIVEDSNATGRVKTKGMSNYGHFTKWINPADDMGWDICILGNELEPGFYQVSDDINTWTVLENKSTGNHKILLPLKDDQSWNPSQNKEQIQKFIDDYQRLGGNKLDLKILN